MDSVEASTASIETGAEPVTVSEDKELGAVWDRLERDNGASRDDAGKFASTEPVQNPLPEGGEGEAAVAAETSTQVTTVPLPSTWRGQEALWDKIPADVRADVKAHEDRLHQTLSEQGKQLSTFKPVGEAINKYTEYFDGTVAEYQPAEAIEYLFGLQKSMDSDPMGTLMQIADTYQLRPILAEMFAPGGERANEQVLLTKIGELETTIRGLADPTQIDKRITAKFDENRMVADGEAVFSRVFKDTPLAAEVDGDELLHFINRSWNKLGSSASPDAVLKAAVDMAINADPDLRAKAAALKGAAVTEPDKVAAAKRANSTNLKSTSTGKTRDLTEDEELAAVWDKNQG